MAMESAILRKKRHRKFQKPTHQITLLAGLKTLSNLFTTKPKKNLFYHINDLFHCILNLTIVCMN